MIQSRGRFASKQSGGGGVNYTGPTEVANLQWLSLTNTIFFFLVLEIEPRTSCMLCRVLPVSYLRTPLAGTYLFASSPLPSHSPPHPQALNCSIVNSGMGFASGRLSRGNNLRARAQDASVQDRTTTSMVSGPVYEWLAHVGPSDLQRENKAGRQELAFLLESFLLWTHY